MSKEPLKALQCPSCGAPLEAKEGARTLKCSYCGTTVSISQEPRPILDIPQNRKQKRQRETVEASDNEVPPASFEDNHKGRLLVMLFIAAMFFVFLIIAKNSKANSYRAAPTQGLYVAPVPTKTVEPPGFAKHILTFGSAGIVPGKFTDAAALTLNNAGNVIVTDWNSGRFNIFDADGNFISTGSTGKDAPITSIAALGDDQILLVHNFEIHIYDAEGKETGVMEDQLFGDAVIAPDGTLHTVSLDNTISRYNLDGVIDLQIQNTFETFAGAPEMTSHLAVDGLGNMYLLGESSSLVLKFSPDGTFLDQFGGVGRTDVILITPVGDSPFGGVIYPTQQPGTFQWPQAIAVDDYGRIYVGDTNGVTVFDANSRNIGSFELKTGRTCKSLTFDRDNHLYVLTDENTVEKYEVPVP